MYKRGVRVAAMLAVLAAGATWYCLSGPGRAWSADAKEGRMQELLKERLGAATELYPTVLQGLVGGTGVLEEVHAAHQALLRARLDVCGTDDERIAALERAVGEAKKQEDIVTRNVKQGIEKSVDALKAKVYRLETEIALKRLTEK